MEVTTERATPYGTRYTVALDDGRVVTFLLRGAQGETAALKAAAALREHLPPTLPR